MNASSAPQQVVPAGPSLSPSPKSSPTTTPASSIQSPTPIAPSLGGGETSTLPDDATIQSNIEKALASDQVLSALDVSTLVESGKVTVVGSVKSPELRQRVERAIRSVKGVSVVDNQLVITEATPL
jgi:osmotically-inducible protein OsmY